MSEPRHIVIAGHLCLDENVTAEGIAHTVGSPAVFIAPVLAAAGCTVSIAAPYGHDFVAALRHAGTALDLLDPPGDTATLVFVNDVRGEVRTQAVRHPESARLLEPEPAALEALAHASALILTPLVPDPNPGVVEQYSAALPPTALRVLLLQGYLRDLTPDPAPADAPTAVPPRYRVEATRPEELDALFSLVDVVTLSDEDLPSPAHLSDTSSTTAVDSLARTPGDTDAIVASWSSTHPRTAFVVTRGASGSSAYLAGARTDAPAHPVGPLAPTALIGAGDTFAAELTLALLPQSPMPSTDLTLGALHAALATANRATALRLAAPR